MKNINIILGKKLSTMLQNIIPTYYEIRLLEKKEILFGKGLLHLKYH